MPLAHPLVGIAQIGSVSVVESGTDIGLERGREGELGLGPAAGVIQAVEIVLSGAADIVFEGSGAKAPEGLAAIQLAGKPKRVMNSEIPIGRSSPRIHVVVVSIRLAAVVSAGAEIAGGTTC